ncbi:MAG TPA: glycoside hydrolase family 15 protein [Woeseiaceae bacterium]|nr:glycoside hydrolase family 15 protein [Woeseiaceae bacterium]
MSSLNLGVIGNCQIASLIDPKGVMVWTCMPQFDSDPVFCRLLRSDQGPDIPGYFDVDMEDFERSEQRYLENTPILETVLHDTRGNAVAITDFAPRYEHLGRMFKPIMLARGLRPVSGQPRIRIRLRPTYNYGASACQITHGSNHIRYLSPDLNLRLTTDASLTYVIEENFFVLDRELHLILGPDESIPQSVAESYRHHFNETEHYWRRWVRGLAIPFEWQSAVIRAAISLKLCTFEDTGAVIAAMTTSIPEAANSGRNWDYRYCWLRDSYFVVHALNRLGATLTMEAYLRYIVNVSTDARGGPLQPVYSVTGRAVLTESEVTSLDGYRGMGPVRVGNQAYVQTQNDVYGAVILAATRYFFDQRLLRSGLDALFERLEHLGEKAATLYKEPDAGLWEYRGRQRVHTFSSIMCWAGCDHLTRIAGHLNRPDRAVYWGRKAAAIHRHICEQAWDDKQKSFTEAFGRPEMDASLLTMNGLGFLAKDDPRFISTIKAIESGLRRGQHMFRYGAADDFGEPENAFNICTFWYIDALATVGRTEEARELFENMLCCRTDLGLLSEDINPETQEPWGNFPQTYSMAGIINTAVRLSRTWEDVL